MAGLPGRQNDGFKPALMFSFVVRFNRHFP
uniref:Uncharacterized protein n=1 Tax=Arundo donax TaxID=35708 RepID=A0A0A9H2Y5_ARUDO